MANLSSVGSPDVNKRASADMADRMKPRKPNRATDSLRARQGSRPQRQTAQMARPQGQFQNRSTPGVQAGGFDRSRFQNAAPQPQPAPTMQAQPYPGRPPQAPQPQAGWGQMAPQPQPQGVQWMNSTGMAPVRPAAPTYGYQPPQPRSMPQMQPPPQFNPQQYNPNQQRFDPYNQPRSPWGQPQQNPFSRRW